MILSYFELTFLLPFTLGGTFCHSSLRVHCVTHTVDNEVSHTGLRQADVSHGVSHAVCATYQTSTATFSFFITSPT
ncbi:hypothetical protein CROQUDRAFT_396172 [Cronartium quercuum f. sp. fusiforme G11]|uniref:Secreted protein n=1 Tax=Cronartium quercuum f. sp. fusiforme G11 TaxID=708437 RepID=A0A9P6N6F0_9BASI|nr:hypothetical protein CROQUDRAFT_396172 [Cronartium quercuum f. sp. fusiforme G11]